MLASAFGVRSAKEPIAPVWAPIPGSSQEIALDTRCHHTLYCGTRGPGKSDTQLMKFRRYVGQGYGAFWRGIIFDREYKNLDDLVIKSQRWFPQFGDGAQWLSAAKDYKWRWPTGEELLFRAVKESADYWDYHGHEFPYMGWNELCKFPSDELYEKMMSLNRTSFVPELHSPRGPDGRIAKILPAIPLIVFSTTNPAGAGHSWVKRRFIDPAPYGHVVRKVTKVFNPRNQQDEFIEKTQVAIFGSYRENIYLPPEYIADLDAIKDENLRRAWLLGDWNIVAGGAVSDVWMQSKHVIPQFNIPATWYVDRAFDWGSSEPFYVGWFAEANGEEAKLPDGTSFCPPPGTLILFNEWYGTKEPGSNKGMKLSAGDIADGINYIEKEMLALGRVAYRPWAGPADNQIRNVRERDVDTIEAKMADKRVFWTVSDKSPGSRVNGLQLVRDRLAAVTKQEGPGLYFTHNCTAAISTVPNLPRDDKKLDDVDTDAEDHPYDVVRYRVLAGTNNRVAKNLQISWPR